MPQFSLEIGLVVRRGSQLLEFLRLLDGNKIQFEDQRTRHVSVMKLSAFYAELMSKKIQPVIGDVVDFVSEEAGSKRPILLPDISSMDEKWQSQLERRLNWVRALRKRSITRGQRSAIEEAIPAIAKILGDGTPPKSSTLMDWMHKFDASCQNPAALLSGNYCRKRDSRVHVVVEELIDKKLRSVYLTPARHTLRHAYEQIFLALKKMVDAKKIESQDAHISMATVSRRLSEFEKYDVTKARLGVGHARAKFRTTVEGSQAVRAMQRLECDHTLLNWVVICDRTGLPLGRPTLTIIVDGMSGYVVGIYVSFNGPGLTSVLNVVKNAIAPKDDLALSAGAKQPWLAFGIGETLVLDNGLEFHARAFQLAAWELGVDLEYCRVRTPWVKPKVERFFANLDHFSLTRGRVRKPMNNVLNIDPTQDAAIMFSDFVRGLIQFVVDVYPFELNSRKLCTPFESFRESFNTLAPPAFLPSMDQLDLIAAMRADLTVGPGGIELQGITYSSTDVLYMKREVGHKFKTGVKWNPDDLSFVYLQHPVKKDWLPVPSIRPDYTDGLSWTQHRLIRRHAREKHVQGGGVEQLLLARQELHETWMNGIVRRNRSQDLRTASKLSGISSNQILLPKDKQLLAVPHQKLIVPESVSLQEPVDIEPFESFVMRSSK